jgi:hypothetical protein
MTESLEASSLLPRYYYYLNTPLLQPPAIFLNLNTMTKRKTSKKPQVKNSRIDYTTKLNKLEMVDVW